MSEVQVPLVQTPISLKQYVAACRAAWPSEMGGHAPHHAVGVLWAQYFTETGGSACWNWNIGNVKRIKGDGNPWYVIGGNREHGVVVGPAASMFRAFPDLATAMALHIRFLYKRYPKSWAAICRGEPDTCATALYNEGPYYTGIGHNRDANIAAYANSMRARFAEFLRRVPKWEEPEGERIVTVRDLADVVSGAKRE